MENNKDLRLAVLIDADNISYRNIKAMIEEITKYGTPTFKRIYGDWTRPNLRGWKQVLLENAIIPIQQYSYTSGKNSSDSAMIIDAMDILYTGRVDGFCLVSSDSDFTRLATRLREAGMKMFGIGEKKTPEAFRAACDKFIYVEILESEEEEEESQDKTAKAKKSTEEKKNKKKQESVQKIDLNLKRLITSSINDIADEEGWAYLGSLGNHLIKKQPDFDPRNYGFRKLTLLIKELNFVEIDARQERENLPPQIFVRTKS